MLQLEKMVSNLLTVLSQGFQILQLDQTTSFYSLHLNQYRDLRTLIIVSSLEQDFRFPINVMRVTHGIASCGDIYKGGVDQFLIVIPIGDREYVAHAINRDLLLENYLSDWIIKNPVHSKADEHQQSWDILVPDFELEAIAYKSFTQKI